MKQHSDSPIDWEYQIAYQRGIEAMNWANPAISFISFRKGNFALGGGYKANAEKCLSTKKHEKSRMPVIFVFLCALRGSLFLWKRLRPFQRDKYTLHDHLCLEWLEALPTPVWLLFWKSLSEKSTQFES
jgi:hypothetical protein